MPGKNVDGMVPQAAEESPSLLISGLVSPGLDPTKAMLLGRGSAPGGELSLAPCPWTGHGGGCPPRCRSWWDSRSSGCQANADILPALFGYSFNNPPPPAAPSSQPSAGGVSTAQQNPRLSCSRLQAPKSCWKFIFLLNIRMRSLKCRQVV